MAAQTVTTVVNYDDASISGLLDGETITINGGTVTVDSDVRWNQQAAVFGAVTLSSTLGGSFLIDGTQVWEVPFSASTGNVPTQAALGSNGVTGGTSGATGELLRVWATGSLTPEAAGGAMPATGWIKLRSKTGTFQNGETITLPGGATITASGAGKRSWIQVVGREATTLTIPRLGNFSVNGSWYELGQTDGTDGQQFQFPVTDECPAIQIETAPGSGVYEWWMNGANRWIGNAAPEAATVNGTTVTADNIVGPTGALSGGQFQHGNRLRETATSAPHGTGFAIAANTVETGTLTFRTFIKKETRRWILVQAQSGTARYGALVDLDTGSIIANPTVGTPTATSSTITALTSGWYMVELTLAHTLANTGSLGIYLANSATPTYDANGLPTYLGVTTEGGYYAEGFIITTTQQISTDARGKYFGSDATNGIITIASRTGITAGQKPASGCKVRIPNVILSSANPLNYSINTQHASLATRYDLTTTSAGAVDIENAVCNWYTGVSNPASINFGSSAFSTALSLSNVAGTTTIGNIAVASSRAISAQPVAIANCFSGGTISTSRFTRNTTAATGIVVGFTTAKDFTISECQLDTFPAASGRVLRAAYFALSLGTTDTISVIDSVFIGAGANLGTANRTTITNLKYADMIFGTTQAVAAYAFALLTCDTFDLDGFAAFDSITNVHPYAGIISTNTSCANVTLKNIGTATAPYDAGSANAMGLFGAFLGTTVGVTMRRIYGQNLRTAAISTVNTIQNLRMYNVWADGADSQVMVAVDALAQGCRWTNPSTVQTAVYGTHWEDSFVSTTDGRLMIIGNEPIASTASQCSSTFGTGAGFTSAGNASVPNLSDTITWTMPYFALGHTGIAKQTSNVFTNPWLVTGTNVQFLEFEYQIDTGSGFSAWKHLFNQGRRAAGGGAGTNTVTLTTSERTAMLRQPQIGDYVQSGSNKLPWGTTITNVSGDILTLSNNFTSALTANEAIHIYKDIADETISSTTGYKLKVRLKVNTANSSNLFSFLRIPFDTTSSAQQEQYPLPSTQLTASVTGIETGSRIQVYNITTSTEVANEVVAGTSWSLLYDEGTTFTNGDTVRVRIRKPGFLPYETLAISSLSGWAILADQQTDTIFSASSPANFSCDFVNQKIRATGSRASFTAQEVVDIIRDCEATSSGIQLPGFADISGLVELAPSVFTAITVDLLGWQLSWAAGSVSQASVSGGNVVGGLSGDPIEDVVGGPQVTVRVSADATVVATGSGVLPADITAIAAAVWDTVLSGHLTAGTTGAALDDAAAGGGGGGSGDWTTTEKNQIRHRLGIDGTASAPTTGVPSLATPASVRTELTTELGRIDVATSTRLASASYTAPPTVAAIRTEMDTNSTKLDVAVGTRLASASYTTPPTAAANATAVRTELTTELGRIDVATSTRLASASYTAPANADIAAIKAKTDNLPSDPADESSIQAAIAAIPAAPTASTVASAVRTELTTELARIDVATSTRLATSGYTAPANADIAAIKAKTDNLPSDPADESSIQAAIAAIPAAPSASSVATAVRTELTTELGRIDVATSTRLATAGYTAPDNATIAAIDGKVDNLPTLAEVEASTVLAKEATVESVKQNTDLIPATV